MKQILKCVLVLLLLINGGTRTVAQNPARPTSSGPVRTIAVDFNRIKGPHNKFFREVVGAGRAAEGLRADWQRDLALVQKECGFKYIRFHGLLQDEMGVYNEDKQGRPVYNFQYVDALYDAILATGMRPFVEFGFMPQALASGSKTIFWWKGNITPPKDYDKWTQLITALVQHWTIRYGTDEVKQWLFEVWNEPNLDIFWSGDQAEYFKLYDVTARAIKLVSSAYRVGGPATAGHAWIPETIAYAFQRGAPLDFITTHDYGVSGRGFDDGVQQLYLDTKPEAIIASVQGSRLQIAASELPRLPLHFTEWSSSYSPRDPVHDSYISAAYILSKLKGSEGFADSMSYWTFTDIFEENGVVPSPFHGGFGLVNFQGLRKPSFYAYRFLNQLAEVELLTNDSDSWACRNAHNMQVLLWNYTAPVTDESDQKFFKRDIPPADMGQARISIKGLAGGTYKMNLYRVGYKVNDVYASYLELGAPPSLTRAQVRDLAQQNSGAPIETATLKLGATEVFQKDVKLRQNDVYLLTLEK